MATDKNEVGRRLRALRQERKLTHEQLAATVGLSRYTVKIAEQANLVSWRTAKRLGDLFGVDPRELVTRE
jgi:DNA-binding XRE family transcriptional regulator